MVQWFHENYEDPAVRLPYESREGGYQWIWGGPYDAREQIGDQFSDIADEDTIEAAVEEVTRDGLLDWAPRAGREHEYLGGDDAPELDPPAGSLAGIAASDPQSRNFPGSSFAGTRQPSTLGDFFVTDRGDGIVDEKGNRVVFAGGDPVDGLRREMLARLDDLEAVLKQTLNVAPNRGHNHPPELLEVERPVTQEQFQEIFAAIEEV